MLTLPDAAYWWDRTRPTNINNDIPYNPQGVTAATTIVGAHPVIVYGDMAMWDQVSQKYVTPDQTTRSINS